MRFVSVLILGLILSCGLAACGGGGGDDAEVPSAPGVLRTLALQGESAPDTGYDFAAFDTEPPMDVATGGWSVFVANTTKGAGAKCVYAAGPDGDLILVYSTDDNCPDTSGDISDIDAVWILPDGRILVKVGISGDGSGRTEGLISAEVGTGAVVNRKGVLFDQRSMVDIGLSGTLDEIRDDLLVYRTDGLVYVPIVTSAAEEALLRVESDGSDLLSLVKDGDALPPGGSTFLALHALEVNPDGTRFAFVAERDDNSRALYVGHVESLSYGLLFEEGDDLTEGVAADIPGPQPLLIDNAGRVLFKTVSSENADHLLVVAHGFAPSLLAYEGGVDTWTGGEFEDLDWVHNERGGSAPFFMAEVGANANGVTFGIYLLTDLLGDNALAMWDNRAAPAGLGANLRFTSTFPGLAGAGRLDADAIGSLAFANVLNSGRPGVFWLIQSSGLFTIAAGGDDIPGGGDTFAGGNAWRTTTAVNVLLFRAPVLGAGSGIFRRGP